MSLLTNLSDELNLVGHVIRRRGSCAVRLGVRGRRSRDPRGIRGAGLEVRGAKGRGRVHRG
jgi:hypothetical protein